MTERLEQLASEKASREEIERAARAEGMRSLWEDGVAKVARRPDLGRRARPRLLH